MGSIPGLGNLLEKDVATGSNILAWKIPWTEKPHRLLSMGDLKKSDTTKHTYIHKVKSISDLRHYLKHRTIQYIA